MLAALLTEYRGLVIVLFVLPGGYIFDAVIALVGWFTKLLGKGYATHEEKVCCHPSRIPASTVQRFDTAVLLYVRLAATPGQYRYM